MKNRKMPNLIIMFGKEVSRRFSNERQESTCSGDLTSEYVGEARLVLCLILDDNERQVDDSYGSKTVPGRL